MSFIAENDDYNDRFINFIVKALYHKLEQAQINLVNNKFSKSHDQITPALMTSLFKHFKELRYENDQLYSKLTDIIIQMVNNNKADETLVLYSLNRLANLNEKENFLKLYEFLNKKGSFKHINNSQNMVMLA